MHSLDELLEAMTSPDPAVRDGRAYAELSAGIRHGRFAADHSRIRRRAVEHLGHAQVQARTFAPLILTWLLQAGEAPAEPAPADRAAAAAVLEWYVTEPDTRGYDDQLGWLHAVAHGADYIAAAVETGVLDPGAATTALAERMVADGPQWIDQEDARVASAMMRALRTCSVTGDRPGQWRSVIDAALDAYEVRAERGDAPLRPSMWLRNVTSTLALLYVAASEESGGWPGDARDDVLGDVAGVLARVTPFLVQPRG